MPLKMLNVASYLPHHIVAVAVVVLASNTPMSKIHFCMFNIGKHLITMLLLLLQLNLTSYLAFISSWAILMLMVFSSSHISIVTEKLSTALNPAGARSCDRASHPSGTCHDCGTPSTTRQPCCCSSCRCILRIVSLASSLTPNSQAMTNGPELEKAEPSRRATGGPCTMKAQDILMLDLFYFH